MFVLTRLFVSLLSDLLLTSKEKQKEEGGLQNYRKKKTAALYRTMKANAGTSWNRISHLRS